MTSITRSQASTTPIPEGPIPEAVTRALRETTPFVVSLVPFALAIGASAATVGLSLAATITGGALLLAGNAQISLLDSIGTGTGTLLAIAAAVLINLRFAVYGLRFGQWFADEPLHRRLLMALPLVDPNYLLCDTAFREHDCLRWRRQYYLAISAALAATYLGFQVVGYAFAASLPDGIGLEMAAPLAFAAMLGRACATRTEATSAIVAGAVVVGTAPLGSGIALPMALVLGAAAGSGVITNTTEVAS